MSNVRVLAAIREGSVILGSDGTKLGSIVAVRSNYLVAERGFFTPVDYFVPLNAVAEVKQGTVLLKIPGETALANRWDEYPHDFDGCQTFTKDATAG